MKGIISVEAWGGVLCVEKGLRNIVKIQEFLFAQQTASEDTLRR